MLADKSSASRLSSSTIKIVCATPAFPGAGCIQIE
jgi:hypothetical protein